jgi:UPF0176 protein
MQIQNIAGYKFIPLTDLSELRSELLQKCNNLQLKGTILLSSEGVNMSLAATPNSINEFKSLLKQDARFADISFRESVSDNVPFKFMRIKLKKEIITMKRPEVRAEEHRAPSLSPQELKRWYDEKRPMTVLDTRNDYEYRFGSFRDAINLGIDDFSDFPKAAEQVSKDQPVVMFCTGGIRCEKAALHLLNAGYPEVYQLEGGILNYFAEVGGDYYDGECFVFDQRISLDANLQVTGTGQCTVCEGPIKPEAQGVCPKCSDII